MVSLLRFGHSILSKKKAYNHTFLSAFIRVHPWFQFLNSLGGGMFPPILKPPEM
jgi:hypothetical protein